MGASPRGHADPRNPVPRSTRRPTAWDVAGRHHGCRATLVDFLSAIDHGRATDALELFTDDASFAARGQQLQGRRAIADFLQERQAEAGRHTVHVLSNEIVRSATPDRLELMATLLLHEREPDGHYAIHQALNTTQTFHRHHDRWRIHTRSTPADHPPPS